MPIMQDKIIVESGQANRSGIQTNEMTSASPDKLVGNTFKSILINESGELVVGPESSSAIISEGLDTEYTPTFSSGVNAMAKDKYGRIYIGGVFTTVNSVAYQRLVRLLPSGELDTLFPNMLVDGGINDMAIDPIDGETIYIVGSFQNVNGQARNRIAKIDRQGNLQALNTDINGEVFSIYVESGSGRIIVGGSFTQIASTARQYFGAINANGTLNTQIPNLSINGFVRSIKKDSELRIVFGGEFNSVGGTTQTKLGRLLTFPGGSVAVDKDFVDPNIDGNVLSIDVSNDSSIVIGGLFSNVGGQARNKIARVSESGSVASIPSSYVGAVGGDVYFVREKGDGGVIVGGTFTTLNSVNRKGFGILNNDFTLDESAPNLEILPLGVGVVRTGIYTDKGNFLIGGNWATIDGIDQQYAAHINLRKSIYTEDTTSIDQDKANQLELHNLKVMISDSRINSLNGDSVTLDKVIDMIAQGVKEKLNFSSPVDYRFDIGADGVLFENAFDEDSGKVLLAGFFTSIGGTPRTHVARLNADGTLDKQFTNPNITGGHVNTIRYNSNVGGYFIAGQFTTVGASTRTRVARLYNDGTVNNGFVDAEVNGNVRCMHVYDDGKVLIGGDFTTVHGSPRSRLARLNADGTLDNTFTNPGIVALPASGSVYGMRVNGSGDIFIVGNFNEVDGQTRVNFARIDSTGSIDLSFVDTNLPSISYAILPQFNNELVIGGDFGVRRYDLLGAIDNTFVTTITNGVRALVRTPSNEILVGGSVAMDRLALINNTGANVASFINPIISGGTVSSLATNYSPTLGYILGGNFTSVSGENISNFVRLNASNL